MRGNVCEYNYRYMHIVNYLITAMKKEKSESL